MNEHQLPQGPIYMFTWSIPKNQLSGWNITLNPVPRDALAVPEVVEDLGDMTEARAVIDYIKGL